MATWSMDLMPHMSHWIAGVSDPRWPHASPFMTFVQTMLRVWMLIASVTNKKLSEAGHL